ncbi:MAG: hypothetical protein KC636_20800, partial [Myxococcales bacterium]|nr:hypothetical protein [Myxococcales bacterium]
MSRAARARRRLVATLLFGPAAIWAALAAGALAVTALDADAWGEVDRARSDVRGSARCQSCHPGQFDSWHRSYHRTMTQEVGAGRVLAPFRGETLDYLGLRATFTGGAAAPHLRVAPRSEDGGEGPAILDVDVVMTVGSHRYQQYLARLDRGGGEQEVWRLPVAWHRGAGRWIHMNAAFLEPEGAPGSEEDYLRHLNRWNDNCVLCHNTAPVPGRGVDGAFATRVGELGIACEACHGPASAHLARHKNPVRRILSNGAGDASIAHPGRLRPREESGVCGRCHGQRISADVAAVLRDGDGFLPGEDLADVSRPIFRDSTLGDDPERLFESRFWPDGSPRLSAYEYQGLLLSPCYRGGEEGGLGCGHCHTMHGDDPDLQLRPERSGDAACEGCHPRAQLSSADAARGHGGHGAAVSCQGCHMPRITYGLLQGMISHRITTPAPARSAREDMPDACTRCHVDRSRDWAIAATSWLSGGAAPSVAGETSQLVRELYGGDPIERGLAAHALARPEATGADARTRMAWMVDALEDEYPAIRWMVWRALGDLATRVGDPTLARRVARYDPLADAANRLASVDSLRAQLGPG